MIFQILFCLFAVAAMSAVLKRKKDHVLGPKGALFWVLFWVLSTVVVLYPQGATRLANILGIGRGSDLVLYIAVAGIFLLLFRLHIKIESTGREVTKLVRERALEKHERDER